MTGGSEAAEPTARPLGDSGRIVALDFVRGVAVLGILFANIVAFAHPMLAYVWPGALPGGGSMADRWLWLAQFTFVDGKFRALFTLLFGAGLCLFVEREWDAGGTGARQLRRLAWLALFGLLHFYLLFEGDILFLYALAGFAVLPMIGWQPRIQLLAGLVWYALASGVQSLAVAVQLTGWHSFRAARDAAIEQARVEAAMLDGPRYLDLVLFRIVEQSGDLFQNVTTAIFETIPLLLIGMALFRFGFFSGALDRGRMLLWGWAGLLLGAAGTAILGGWAMVRGFPFWLTQFVYHGPVAYPRLAMALGMASLLVLATPRAPGGWLGNRLIAAGRMAFSNYILMSLVMALVFQGWAGGLFGDLHRPALLLPLLGGWLLMLAWSRPWLARFRYGPLEWLWRCLTYRQRFPLLRNRG